MKVYVLDCNGKPLMPTSRGGRVRWLLKTGKAKVVRTIPFTIQLLEEDRKYYTQEISLGIKPGSKQMGLSATSKKEELFCASVKLRTDIVVDLWDCPMYCGAVLLFLISFVTFTKRLYLKVQKWYTRRHIGIG